MKGALFTGAVLIGCKDIQGGEVPKEIQVIPHGYHDTPKGPFICDEESVALVINDFADQINDMVIDYEHQTLHGDEAPAAGWIKKGGLIDKGKDGIWAVVEWTDRAKEYIKNKEYRYVSPVFLKRLSDNKVIKLVNVALTNQPNIDGMVPIINKGIVEALTNTKEETKMKNALALLGLPENATEEDVIQSINKLKTPQSAIVANKAVLDLIGLKEGASESEVVATVMAMKQGADNYASLSQKVATLEKSLKERDAEEMVNSALKDGKITADQKDWASKYAAADPEGFKVFIAKAPQVVPMGSFNKGGDDAARGSGMDEEQLEVNKLLGITDETFKKHNSGK